MPKNKFCKSVNLRHNPEGTFFIFGWPKPPISMLFRKLLTLFLLAIGTGASGQPQDVTFHLNAHLLPGQKILKVKRDFYDPYVWVLAANDQVYRVNSLTLAVDNYTATFAAYSNLQFIDIAGRSQDTVFIACSASTVIHYANGTIHLVGAAVGMTGNINSIGIAGGNPQIRASTANMLIATDQGLFSYNSDSDQLTVPKYSGSYKLYQATYRAEMLEDSSENSIIPQRNDTVGFQPVAYYQAQSIIIDAWLWEGGKAFGSNFKTADYILSDINANEVFADLFWADTQGLSQSYAAGSSYFDPPLKRENAAMAKRGGVLVLR